MRLITEAHQSMFDSSYI